MGDMADFLFDQELDFDDDERAYDNLRERVWITNDGKRLLISDMSEIHLANIIVIIEEGRSNHFEEWIPILQKELNSR